MSIDPVYQAARTAFFAADTRKPDLVIHVGDYYYRENACPPNKGCADSPFGDHWPTWQAELFDPAGFVDIAPPGGWVPVE